MKHVQNKAFTLVELLVVITILAIISVVAYQSFGGAVGKALSGRKLSDVASIQNAIMNYKVENNYYPIVDIYDAATNKWGYNDAITTEVIATPSNTFNFSKDGDKVKAVTAAAGGGRVKGIADTAVGGTDYSATQIGAKGTISQKSLGKDLLSTDLYDPELGEVNTQAGKLIDEGIGRYVYAVYKKPLSVGSTWAAVNLKGSHYNIAYTLKKEGTEEYITKIAGDFENDSCKFETDSCPDSLIGSGGDVLSDNQTQSSYDTTVVNQGIPYPISF